MDKDGTYLGSEHQLCDPYSLLLPDLPGITRPHQPDRGTSFLSIRSSRRSFILLVQAARSNEEAAAAVLTNIQTLADIIGSSREQLVSRITPLSTADQEALHRGVADKPSFQDPFDEFLKYVLTRRSEPTAILSEF